MKKPQTIIIFWGLMVIIKVLFISPAAAQQVTVDAQKIEALERLIKEQQKQLESLQQQLNQLKQTAVEAQTQAREAKSAAEEAKSTVKAPADKVVTSGQERVKLAVSGQVNRAVNVVDDGDETRAYFVDSDASNSRVRFVGTAKATEDLTIGSRIELSIAPNESSDVNQEDQDTGTFFSQRWADISLDSRHYGKLSLGYGDTASNNTAEVDLSRTDVIAYASVADIVGGMLFRQKSDNALTNIKVSNAFNDLDGLSRKSRIRYDTPTFHGFHLAASGVSDQRYDASLWWGGQGYGFKAAGAFGYANPNQDDSDYQFSGSFSTLHEKTGLNLTLSAGLKDSDNGDDPTNFYIKGGWLTRFFSVGDTAFSIDYDESDNFPSENDDGWSMGGAVVQQFEKFGTELYVQYRYFTLDLDGGPDVYDMNAFTIGSRVKF